MFVSGSIVNNDDDYDDDDDDDDDDDVDDSIYRGCLPVHSGQLDRPFFWRIYINVFIYLFIF